MSPFIKHDCKIDVNCPVPAHKSIISHPFDGNSNRRIKSVKAAVFTLLDMEYRPSEQRLIEVLKNPLLSLENIFFLNVEVRRHRYAELTQGDPGK